MDLHSLPDDAANANDALNRHPASTDLAGRSESMRKAQQVDQKLQFAVDSLQQSASAIHMLLAAQSPADLVSPTGIALRDDLEALLASSTHLSRLAKLMQQDFDKERQLGEQRSEREIANVVDAVARHRAAVQDNAIALTEAALDKARSPSPVNHASRAAERRPR